ncbi:transcriptional regulator, partial [Salmonella enterica]|nr:transcriptional regulator [Salmonella enterica]
MRKYTINSEFIYNESLREIISLRDEKVLKVTLMRARC